MFYFMMCFFFLLILIILDKIKDLQFTQKGHVFVSWGNIWHLKRPRSLIFPFGIYLISGMCCHEYHVTSLVCLCKPVLSIGLC